MADKSKAPKDPPKPSNDKSGSPFKEPPMQKFHGSHASPPKKKRP